jgi:hypothetical protein
MAKGSINQSQREGASNEHRMTQAKVNSKTPMRLQYVKDVKS